MCRVKEGKAMKPGTPGGAQQPRRRGRPAIDWTLSRKRRLLRLYLCTPESELSLKKILELLAEGPFQPKPRHTQCLLNDMLSKSYRQKRPRNRSCMGERLAYLRSVRDRALQTSPQPGARPEVVKECAILLRPNPGRRRANMRARDAVGELDELDSLSSPAGQRADTASPTSSASEEADVGDPSPVIFKNPWSSEEIRFEKVDFLRERCSSRSSSFLSDAASLLSGLSIRSGLSRSSSGFSRRSIRSISSRADLTSASGIHGDWDLESRPLSATESTSHSRTWSDDLNTTAASSASWVSQMADHTIDNETYLRSGTPHTLENQELVRFCCSTTAWCLHQRINAVLAHSTPADTFSCTPAEANARDGLGNTALHVAARWGAPGPVLFRIMTLATHLNTANHRSETFLHVLDPTALAPREIAHFTKYLASRGFQFTHLDDDGQSFVDRLLANTSFTLESLEAIFSHLPEADRLALLHRRHQLLPAIRARFFGQHHNAPTSPSLISPATSYIEYFTARYGTPSSTVL